MTMTAEQTSQVHEFKAHTQQLLWLMIHSLYTQKDIFLRELASNASDALDRLRFESIRDHSLADGSEPPTIRLEVDSAQRTLTVHDNGIGMSRDEVIANIGTIARSGTQELLEELKGKGQDALPELIGRFGVGFYSAFMVADSITLVTRRAGDPAVTRWASAGDGQYTISDGSRPTHGTSVTLQLKRVDPDAGIEDYADEWVLARIVKQYSDFIAYPIVLAGAGGAAAAERTLNSQKPLWARSPAEVSDEEYRGFYHQLTHDRTPPLLHLAARAEGRIDCQVLVYVPAEAPQDLHYHGFAFGLRLYARRVLVLERCPDLLPRYLRFVTGAVDVLDLPLNISRQMLQESRNVAEIRKWLTRTILGRLAELQQHDPETYLKVWRQYGRALKEALGVDYQNRDRLLSLFLFESSRHPSGLTTLDQYVERTTPDQTDIYYLTGESRDAIEHAPHVEAARERGFEVLYLIDPVDDLLVQSLTEHAGKRVRSLGKGTLDWARSSEDAAADSAHAEAFASLTRRLEELLTTHVKRVRLSMRLTASPACLVGEEYDYTPRMERLLMKGKGGGPRQRRILELNPTHPVVTKLKERQATAADDPRWVDYAELLLSYALLTEGSEPADPVRFTRALVELMQQSF